MSSGNQGMRRRVRQNSLALVIAATLAGTAYGQSTTSSVFGVINGTHGGDTVEITSSTGISRQMSVAANGRYSFGALPLGDYTISLLHDGKVVSTRAVGQLRVNIGTQIDFTAPDAAKSLAGVTVTATTAPAIDVSSVDSRTVFTAQDLANLPLARSAEDIAMLAPGTVSAGAAYGSRIGAGGGNLVSFGGASGAENAYYINGFNTTDPYKGEGGLELPYGVIDQQEVLTGGYSAMYGRSDGGVINQIGKSGTNEWHFGLQAQWEPSSLMSDPKNIYYANNRYKGDLYDYRNRDKSWTTRYSGYFGGPLIKDHLYWFTGVEFDRTSGTSTTTSAVGTPYQNNYRQNFPKWYTKVNWNITQNNILELTALSSTQTSNGENYAYNYDTLSKGDLLSHSDYTKTGGRAYIGKFTSYITDNLTFSMMYGRMRLYDTDVPYGYDPSEPYLSSVLDENTGLTGGKLVSNNQTVSGTYPLNQGSAATNFRADFEYQLGDHKIRLGVDNETVSTIDQGTDSSTWTYAHNDDATAAIDPADGIGAPGGNGYYVMNETTNGAASVKTVERAQYLEDNWQVSDRWLVSLGVRSDNFANYNNSDVKFTNSKRNISPRLGFSWDVFGDSSMKVYGNLGRYYLAINNNTAYDGATGYAWTRSYYTYTGISANGTPTGLTEIGSYAVDGHTGKAPDPNTIAASNLGAEYQDEAMLGITKAFTPEWIGGAKLTVRRLGQISDDVCDVQNLLIAKAEKMYKLTSSQITQSSGGCYIINPGKTNDMKVATTNGYVTVPMGDSDWGYPRGPIRKYYALELFMEHPLGNGRWGGKIDYVFSRSYGNTSGLLSNLDGDTSVGVTQDWDNGYVMQYSNGVQSNDRTNQLKFNGQFRISPEWLLSGVINIATGAPKDCLGYYGPSETLPDGYSKFHWCNGVPETPGSMGRMPTTHRIDVNLAYAPEFAKHRLSFNISVFNLLNEQRGLLDSPVYNSSSTPTKLSDTYGIIEYREQPRYVRFGVNYDF
ncbi:TonB-dependent receptor [Frateuria aurantia]